MTAIYDDDPYDDDPRGTTLTLQVLLGGGAWTAKSKKKFRKKY